MNQINGPYSYLSPYQYLPQNLPQFIPDQVYGYLPAMPPIFQQQPLTVENYRQHNHTGDSFEYSNAYKTITNPSQAIVEGLAHTAGNFARTILSFTGKK